MAPRVIPRADYLSTGMGALPKVLKVAGLRLRRSPAAMTPILVPNAITRAAPTAR
jgi:hypothetical protein